MWNLIFNQKKSPFVRVPFISIIYQNSDQSRSIKPINRVTVTSSEHSLGKKYGFRTEEKIKLSPRKKKEKKRNFHRNVSALSNMAVIIFAVTQFCNFKPQFFFFDFQLICIFIHSI